MGPNNSTQTMTAMDCVLVTRSDASEIQRQHNTVASNSTLTCLLDMMPHTVGFLNLNRQIIWLNRYSMKTLNLEEMGGVLGLRPGEALGCVNAIHAEYGCGTAKECRTCGTLQAILRSLNEKGAETECMILTTRNEALNYRINASLIDLEGEALIAVSAVDISDEKNKRILEHLFFHDIMNLAGSIQGFANILPDLIRDKSNELSNIVPILSQGTDDLIELIKSQKDLLSAETNELSVYNKSLDAQELLQSVKALLERNDLLQGRQIKIHDTSGTVRFSSDERILKRVITNVVKNALEAIQERDVVHLRYHMEGDHLLFEIQNSSYMPEDVQSQIFRKSFSTKSRDRGIGTYSIKLFTEKYLNGKVWFTSRKGEGTTFYIQIPVQ